MQPLGVDEPSTVGPYRLLGRLGSGGMGRVYLGRSAGGRTVAVKIVHPHFALDEEFRARFRREVEAARRVGGAWTAPVLDADPEAAVPWVATGYAAGPSLSAAVTDGGPLPASTVRALGAGLAEALAAVHDLGLVHRDVKPSNVLLTLDGPLLIDFGIARASDGTASLTSTGVSIGSPGYMSPEQILGKGATGAADVFSLGAVLAYAAAGAAPFPGDSSAALLYKVVHEEPELGPLDGELRELVAACLAKDPDARPAPGEVARRLAPEGAARLVTGGWLPGALVEQVSRSAVSLLNLDAGQDGREAPSGPVGFSSPSVTAAALGEFGPPPVMAGAKTPGPPPSPVRPAAVPEPREPQQPDSGPESGPGPGSHPGPHPHPHPGPHPHAGSGPYSRSGPHPVPQDAAPSAEPSDRRGPGRLSVSVSATSQTGPGARGRRLSCTVALAVAGAMAAVTLGSAFLFDLLPGERRDDPSASDDGGGYTPAPSASTSAGQDSSPGSPAAVPAAYLGTWEGQAVALDGTLPMGTFRLTVRRADVGEELGTLRHTDVLGGVCDDVLTLKQVTGKQVVASAVGAESNGSVCNQATHTVRLTPVGDDLEYRSDSEGSGRPEARLSKVG
ncbi:serine/threonine-protein kinase [Streptomyces sp. ALI-76-A]|uniref:serine/threonine-protein kinase n=1 Tax=Streptomyces sp. ALI-76-A TaxID=3025736 RepID=UPI00256F11DC|nr:serine/threonine-protein kinase [Streptomyces sp. ALI-76-A]MDL5203108.1 serine/threonine-protein kinase [Streptomyces sp. ALI-76-A]